MAAHVHAALMAQYAEDAAETDKPWERWQWQINGEWVDFRMDFIWDKDVKYRRKPQMMRATCADGTVVTWPEPERRVLEIEQVFWTIDLGNQLTVKVFSWTNCSLDFSRLKAGIIHLTEEDAQQHLDCLLSLNHGSANWRGKP